MGDIVGVHGPYVKRAKEVIRGVLSKEGIDPDTINAELLEAFAIAVASFYHKPVSEQEFRQLIKENKKAKKAWAFLIIDG
jgi:hypothetical protein